ncbi:LpqB family beta-propeller domain-containing protein [Nocardioides pacificus]
MRARDRRLRGAVLVLVPLLLGALLSGCVTLPESGPVRDATAETQGADVPGVSYEPRPPQPGESAAEIVTHFMEAMTATPVQTGVARKFLAKDARGVWNPELETILYEGAATPSGAGVIEVDLSGAHHLDARGAWLGPLPAERRRLRFAMVVEEGQWRIAEAPDALVVPASWFEQRFRQVSLYFLDPTARILVPEPVYVPRGEQLATTLTRGLVNGPARRPAHVSRTFFPSGTRWELSVPVSSTGVAEVSLQGEPGALTPESSELVLAQLAWTLRQDPSIRSIRLLVGGEPVTAPDGTSEFPVTSGTELSPTVLTASAQIFGLREGRVVLATPGTEDESLDGPLSAPGARLRDFAVDLQGTHVAGISRDGTRALLASLNEDGPVTTPAADGTDLLKPAWDFADRIWLVDRTRRGAEVSVVFDGRRRAVDVPGISGQQVSDFVVSRDGTRLVAVLDAAAGDSVMVSRIVSDERGSVLRATPAQRIGWQKDDPLDVRDLGWRTPTDLAIVHAVTEDLAEIRTISADGSPGSLDDQSAPFLIREDVRRLVSSPDRSETLYVATGAGVVDLSDRERSTTTIDPELVALTYVG